MVSQSDPRAAAGHDRRSSLIGRRALITGIGGQDGSYLAEQLMQKGYEVHGIVRRSSLINTHRLDHIYQDPYHEDRHLYLHYGDVTDSTLLTRLLAQIQPDEVYHLAAQSHVQVSFEMPEYTAEATAVGTVRVLEAIRQYGGPVRFYQASSSEMFGSSPPPQNEETPFHPRSPYGVSKVFAYWATINYREAYGMFAVNGILFNHESPRRGETFVTRKITRGVARIVQGKQEHLYLGNLDAGARLGFRRRLRRCHVAHAAGRHARRLCDRHRRGTHGARVLRGRVPPRRSRLGDSTCGCTRATTDRPKSRSCSATRPRRSAISAGSPRVNFGQLVAMMVDADLALAD